MFLRSDGTWSEIVAASNVKVFQTIVEMGETQEDAIARITKNNTITNGDIVIVKELITDDLYQHTSYIFANNKWIAMDGNYNVENIYLANDLTITADIGVQKLNGAGSKILDTAGKNLKQVLDMILASRTLPKIINHPSVSVVCPEAGSYEVGTVITPTYTATFNDGAYQYNPGENTGVTVSAWSAFFDGKTIAGDRGSFDDITLTDDYNKRIGVVVNHSAGVAPEDNLGNIVTNSDELLKCQIQAGTKTGYSGYIKSFRYQFYGSNVTPIDITNEKIRELSKRQSSVDTLEMSVAEGANQVIIAVPANYTLAKVADNGAFGTDILEKFVKSTISIAGASEGYDTDYNVYVYSPNTALGANTYTISFI